MFTITDFKIFGLTIVGLTTILHLLQRRNSTFLLTVVFIGPK